MLHHSNSRNQRNRGSRIKTLLQATLLLGVVLWLLYQVKHSYDKKNEYLDDTRDRLAQSDRIMFQGRKEKAGSYNDNNVEMVGGNSDVTKPEEGAVDHDSDIFYRNEEKSGESVFDKDSTDLHDDDKRNTERSEAEEGQVNSAVGNTEARNNEDETTDHSEGNKHDGESNSDAEGKGEVHATGDDVIQNNHAQDENTGETNGTSHDDVVQGDEATNADKTNASGNGSDGEGGDNKEAMDTQTGFESLPNDAKTETSGGHDTGSLPDETGNVPSVHTDNDANGNQGDTASTASDSAEHSTSEAVHIETGLGDEGTTTTSGTASGDDKGKSVDSNSSDSTSAEEKAATVSADDEKATETGTANQASYLKEASSEEGSATTEATNDEAANMENGKSQGDSSGEVVNGSSQETKPVDNQRDGATETSNNSEQVDTKIETITSATEEHNESQGGDTGSGSNNPSGTGPEQTGKTETQ